MIKYCPKCHKEAFRTEETDEGVKIIQGGRSVFNFNRSSNINIGISCPSGHNVKFEMGEKVESV